MKEEYSSKEANNEMKMLIVMWYQISKQQQKKIEQRHQEEQEYIWKSKHGKYAKDYGTHVNSACAML